MFDAEVSTPVHLAPVATPAGELAEMLAQAARQERLPDLLSRLDLPAAEEKACFQHAIALCREAIRRAPEDPARYLHLGRVCLLARKKHLALYAFRKGLRHGDHPGLLGELRRLGFRRQPTFPFLGRKHRLNKLAGLLLARLGLR